jgi:hypothetical protein
MENCTRQAKIKNNFKNSELRILLISNRLTEATQMTMRHQLRTQQKTASTKMKQIDNFYQEPDK